MNKIVLVFIFSTLLYTQMMTFRIIEDERNIGWMTVHKRIVDDTTKYELQAKMSFSYMFMDLTMTQKAIWEKADNHFTYSMKSNLDGRESYVRIEKEKDSYKFIRDSFLDSDEFLLKSEPANLFIDLYFAEPNSNSLFSSNFGRSFPLLKSNKTAVYETDRAKWQFSYDDSGKFLKAEFDGFIDYTLVNDSERKQESHDHE